MKKPVIFKVLVALALQNNYMKNCVIAGIALISCVLLALPQVVTAQSYEEVVSSSMESPEYTVMGFGDISYVSRDGNDQDGFFIVCIPGDHKGQDQNQGNDAQNNIKYKHNNILIDY